MSKSDGKGSSSRAGTSAKKKASGKRAPAAAEKKRASERRARGEADPAPKPARGAPSETALALAEVDPEKRKLYAELLAEIEDADRDEKRGWDRKYEAVGEILDASLYLLTPHGTAQDWCKAVLGETVRNASRNARVAKHFSPQDAVVYTVARLDAYLALVEAQTGGPIKGALKVKLDDVRVSVAREGRTRRLPLIETQPRELFAAARDEVGEGKRAQAKRSPIEQAFAGAVHAEKNLAGVTVRVNDGALTLGRIPLNHLALLLKIVRGVDWEAELPGGERARPS